MTLDEYNARLSATMSGIEPGTEIAVLRHLCRTDLYFLLRHAIGRADAEHQWLFDRCNEVNDNPDGYLDLWAREHFKSTIITFARTIQDILRSHGDGALESREACFGIFSHTRPMAKSFLRQIKVELEGNERLKEWFPDILYSTPQNDSTKWSEDEGICVKRKSNPGVQTVEAWGLVDGQPTGKHFTHMVYDDIVTLGSVTSPEMMIKTTDALAMSYNLGTEGGKRRMVGTIYHFNDTYKTVMDRGTAITRKYPVTADGTETGEPVLRSREWVAQRRRDMGPYIFGSQMLLNPVADENQGFRAGWLQYHDGISDWSGMNVYLLIDPANSKKQSGEYTAAWAVGLSTDNNLYVLDMVRDRLNLTQRARLVMDWHRKYKPIQVRYERYGMIGDISHIESLQAEENYRFKITEVAGRTKKVDRIRRLIPLFEKGRIYLPRSLHRTGADGKVVDLVHSFIEEEYKAFPVSVHDDMLDALARIDEQDIPLVFPQQIAYNNVVRPLPLPKYYKGSTSSGMNPRRR